MGLLCFFADKECQLSVCLSVCHMLLCVSVDAVVIPRWSPTRNGIVTKPTSWVNIRNICDFTAASRSAWKLSTIWATDSNRQLSILLTMRSVSVSVFFLLVSNFLCYMPTRNLLWRFSLQCYSYGIFPVAACTVWICSTFLVVQWKFSWQLWHFNTIDVPLICVWQTFLCYWILTLH